MQMHNVLKQAIHFTDRSMLHIILDNKIGLQMHNECTIEQSNLTLAPYATFSFFNFR